MFTGIRKQELPILSPNKAIHLVRRITNRIQPSHNGSHTGSYNIVDGDAGLFNHLECPHMGNALGTTTTQHYSHLLAPFATQRDNKQNRQ